MMLLIFDLVLSSDEICLCLDNEPKISVRKSLLFWKKEWIRYMLQGEWVYIGPPSLEFGLVIKKQADFVGGEDKVEDE